jgi:serine/threonine-protein kinase
MHRRPKGRVIAIILAVLLLAAGVAAGATWLFAARNVNVPSLVGMSKGAAAARAEDRGLDILVVGRERSATIDEGLVVSQSPGSGEIEEGSKIELVLSAGFPLAAIPDVTGLNKELAQTRLHVQKFEVGDIEYEYSIKPVDTVIRQSPAEGKREWHSKINLVVSKGPEPIAVPDVTGKPVAAAMQTLKDAGFAPVSVDAYSDEVPEGKVISTDPTGSEVVSRGNEVQVYVSVGPRFAEFKMPDVRGSGVDEARTKLEGMGLIVSVVQSCAGDTVVETQPIAGTPVHEHDKVALFVC